MSNKHLRDYTEAAVNSRCGDLTHVAAYSRTNLAGGITKISWKEVYTTATHILLSIFSFGTFSAITAPAEKSRAPFTLYFDSESGEFLSNSENEAREKMRRKEEIRQQNLAAEVARKAELARKAEEAKKSEARKLLTEGESAWEKMWNAEKSGNFKESEKMSKLALVKFEASSKLGNSSAQDFLQKVHFKLKSDKCFNEAVDAQDRGNEKAKRKKYTDALCEYNKALSLYQEAIKSCRSGSKMGEKRFTEIQNYVKTCYDNLQKVIKSTKISELQQELQQCPIKMIDYNSIKQFDQGETTNSDPYAAQSTRIINS